MTDQDKRSGRNGCHQYNIVSGKPKFDTPSVTTIAKMISDQSGLMWGAAKETAIYCWDNSALMHEQHLKVNEMLKDIDNLAEDSAMVVRMETGTIKNNAIAIARTHFREVWDVKANTGTIVHECALEWSQGIEANLEEKVDAYNFSATDKAEVLRRSNGCLDALEKFTEDEKPEFIHCEQTVFNVEPYKYAGCYDVLALLPNYGNVILDYKTGQKYQMELELQLNGYVHAKWRGEYSDDGELVKKEHNYSVDGAMGLYLHDDGTYEIVHVRIGEEQKNNFLLCCKAYQTRKEIEKYYKYL
jgi:hypothetical protein